MHYFLSLRILVEVIFNARICSCVQTRAIFSQTRGGVPGVATITELIVAYSLRVTGHSARARPLSPVPLLLHHPLSHWTENTYQGLECGGGCRPLMQTGIQGSMAAAAFWCYVQIPIPWVSVLYLHCFVFVLHLYSLLKGKCYSLHFYWTLFYVSGVVLEQLLVYIFFLHMLKVNSVQFIKIPCIYSKPRLTHFMQHILNKLWAH